MGIKNDIYISDTHIGCQLGLCHPDGAELDNGGTYSPTVLQLKVWSWWEEFWYDWVPRVTKGEPFNLILDGDIPDGRHHNATSQWSQSHADQFKHVLKIFEPIVDRAANLYWVRGTEAHVGPSGENEEILAEKLGAIPNEYGQYARFELWKWCGNALCNVMHHIGTTSRQAYESSALQAELIAEFVEAGRSGIESPDYVIRAHRHRYIKVLNPSQKHECAAIALPCWQLKTPFVYKTAMRVMEPQFGGVLIRQGDEEFYSRHFVKMLTRGRIE